MIRTLAVYLWKEWRDNRAILFGLLIAIPLLLWILSFAIPTRIVNHHVFPPVTALSCFLIALLSLGSDLIPGEMRRNKLDFLRRLPADLATPFVAKALFLGAALSAVTLYGWGLACMFGRPPDKTNPMLDHVSIWAYCLAPWVFAVSCWLPRGALAVPAGGLALLLFGLPIYLILAQPPTPHITPEEITTLMYFVGGWSIFVAFFSWARGARFGRGIASSAWRGALASLVLFVPAWGYTGYRAYEWRQIDPADEGYRIRNGVLSADGKHAYLNCFMLDQVPGPSHVLAVDLETGAWERFGEIEDRAMIPPPMRSVGRIWYRAEPSPVVALQNERQAQRYWTRYFDSNTGEPIKSGWQDMDLESVMERFGEGWHELPAGWSAIWRDGLGWRVSAASQSGIYDPFRKKVYTWPVPGVRMPSQVRPGRWLALERVRRNARLMLVDPETGEAEPGKGLPPGLIRYTVMPDGRVLFAMPRTGELKLVDPVSGKTHVLHEDVALVSVPSVDPVIVSVWTLERVAKLARLDLDTNRLVYARAVEPLEPWAMLPLGVLPDGDLLVVKDGKRLVRVRFGSSYSEVVWPR